MKYSIVKDRQTVMYDTEKFKTFDEWLNLLQDLGKETFDLTMSIERAKLNRSKYNQYMPKKQWVKLNADRHQRLREWRMVADGIILIWPEKISFTSNKFLRLVREKHESVFTEIWPLAASEPTKVKVSTEGRPEKGSGTRAPRGGSE